MNDSSAQKSPVESLAEEFLDRQQRGEKPTIHEYCERYPELADEIREVFEGLALLEDLKPGSADQSGRARSGKLTSLPLERINDYRILQEIGRGGMGVVYEAEQESLRRRVALKLLPNFAAGDAKSVERFQREARAAAHMHHTNIVPVFEVGQDDQHLYYAMQLIQGQGLDVVVEELKRLRGPAEADRPADAAAASRSEPGIAESLLTGRFHQEKLVDNNMTIAATPAKEEQAATTAFKSSSTSSAVFPGNSDLSTAESNRTSFYRSVAQIGLQTASALSYAHARGIIHRDIKPGNLLLDAAGVVWVTDFGLAKTGDSALTHTGDILGTLRYMSPERFRGQCDVRADLYALGVTLYELVALKPAFAASERLQLIEAIQRIEPASLRSIDARIPRDLETIILKSMDKDPKRRYQSADELCEDLERFLEDRPIKARRINLAERFWRWARRNRAIAALTSVAALALVLTAVLSTRFAHVQGQTAATLTELNENLENTNASLHGEKTKLAGANAELLRKSKELARQKYVADLNLIPSLYRDGNIRQVVTLLLQHYPKPGEDDLRGFEWNYWMQAANLHKESFGPHFAPLGSQAISPSGKQIAVSLWWGSVFVLDVPNGLGNRQNRKTLWHAEPEQGPRGLASVAFSNDGKRLIAAGPDDKVRRWNTDTWERLPDIEGHAKRHKSAAEFMILALAVSPTQPIIAFRGQKAGVCFCNVETGREIGRLDSIDPIDVHALAFTTDGKTLLVGLQNSLLRVSVESATQERFVIETVAENIDRETGTTTMHCLACSPDGKQFVAGGDNMIRVWDANKFTLIDMLPTAEPVAVMAYSADGSLLAASTRQNNTVLVWQMPSGRLFKTIRGHSRDVEGVCFVDNDTLWSCGSDGYLMSWNLSRCEPGQRAHHVTKGAVKLAYQSGSDKILLFDSQGVRAASLDDPTEASWWKRADQFRKWSGNSRHLTAWSKDDQLHLWKADGTLLGQWQASAKRMDLVAISSQDDKVGKVAWIENDDTAAPSIVILSVAKGEQTRLPNSSPAGDLTALALSPRCDRLIAMHDPYRTGKARNLFWNIADATPKVMDELYAPPAFDAVFSHDGKNLAVAYWSNHIRVYDAKTGQLKSQLSGHANSVRCLAYSDDDAVLVSGAEDGTVRVWDVLNGELRATLKGHVGTVLAVAISPDMTSIASYAEDQQLRIWRAPSPLRNPRSTHLIALELVHRQQWKEAVPYLRKGAEDAPEDTLKWLEIAPVLAFAGDRELYNLHCLQMAANVRDDPDPVTHERAVKAALLLPDAAVLIPQKSLKILRAALDEKAGKPGTVPKEIRPWLEGASALAHYRAGQYPEALQALPTKSGPASLMALCGTIRALAMHKLGDRNARVELQKAGAAIDENLDFIRINSFRTGQFPFSWHDWLYAEWIRREAEALIGPE